MEACLHDRRFIQEREKDGGQRTEKNMSYCGVKKGRGFMARASKGEGQLTLRSRVKRGKSA